MSYIGERPIKSDDPDMFKVEYLCEYSVKPKEEFKKWDEGENMNDNDGRLVALEQRLNPIQLEMHSSLTTNKANVNCLQNQVASITSSIGYNSVRITQSEHPEMEYAYNAVKKYQDLTAQYEQLLEEKKLIELQLKNRRLRDMIVKVEFHKPYTIVWWNDDTITRVKKQKGDHWNKEAGLMAAMCKKFYEDTNIFNDELRKWCE